MEAHRMHYLFLGDLLGGRPQPAEFYDEAGFVRYDRLAQSPAFRRGIGRLTGAIRAHCAVVVCSEEDPAECHRRLLIGRVLARTGVEVLHLRGDGRVQSEEEVAREEQFRRTKGQKTLFDLEEPHEWKSTRSVSPKRAPPNSLGPCGGPEQPIAGEAIADIPTEKDGKAPCDPTVSGQQQCGRR